MKKLLIATTLLTSLNIFASERTLLTDQKELMAQINDKTLICSASGYGASELKINIKGLDGWTILDHSNFRFGDPTGNPCMTAGVCNYFDPHGFDLAEILRNAPKEEKIIVKRIISEKKEEVESQTNVKVCRRTIIENLETTVMKINFHHTRSFFEDFNIKLCKL